MPIAIDFLPNIEVLIKVLRTLVMIVIFAVIFKLILVSVKKRLLERAKNKKQITNVEVFTRIINYTVIILMVVFAIFSYTGSWTGLGLTVGLFSAALGWALQKPITGIAAWAMIVTKRPFQIGDRVIIGNVKGDVKDISLTHIYLEEVGGLTASEENSGRMILVPNSILFEQNIVNYTSDDEFVLDQVITSITYESNLDQAIRITLAAAKKYTKPAKEKMRAEPYVRIFFQPSALGIHVRYFVPAQQMQETASNITKEIFNQITATKGLELAYPHLDVVLKKNLLEKEKKPKSD